MNIDILFNKTLDEIGARLNSGDEYNILMTAALLRKLLVDGENSLIHQIENEEKPVFHVNVREPLHKRVPFLFKKSDLTSYSWLSESGLDPDIADKNRDFNPQFLRLDQFLGLVVIYSKGQEITVCDLIRYVANKEGAIHKQKKMLSPNETKNILLKELGNLISFNNIPAGLTTLKTISIIVKRDLKKFQIKKQSTLLI